MHQPLSGGRAQQERPGDLIVGMQSGCFVASASYTREIVAKRDEAADWAEWRDTNG